MDIVGWFLESPLYGKDMVGLFLVFSPYGTDMVGLISGISSIWNGHVGFGSWNFLYMERIWWVGSWNFLYMERIWRLWFLEFPLYGTDMVTVRLLQVDPDMPTFRPIDQHKNSDIKYTANGYIPCKG
jgi:hypothetical protein